MPNLVLVLRTDKPESEIGLFEDGKQIEYEKWLAHRQLAETIHRKIKNILESAAPHDRAIGGIVIYKGPGSFTGLRIGMSVANALAYSLNVPIIAASGDNWAADGIKQLNSGEFSKPVVPEYGMSATTTTPKK